MAKKKNREFDTSPMALGRQQKNSAAQKADQKRSASSNGKNNPRVAKNNTQSTAPIAHRSEQATQRAGRNQERFANQRRVQSGGTAQQMREQKTNLGQKPKQMSFTEKQEQAQQKVAERKAGKKETGNRFLANEKQVGVNKENRFADITAGTLKQIGGGHLTSLGHDSNDYNEFKKNLEQQVIDGKISESTMNKNLEAYKRANTKANRDQDWQDSKLHKTFQKIEQKGQELNAKGDAQVEKAKEGLGTGGKLLADAYSSTLGMASDMMLGPAWAASMMSRSYGNTLNSTRELVDKGIITEKEAENNAGLQAIKEAATEYMFAGAGLAKGLKGVGKATEAFEGQLAKGIDKLAARLPEGILRNAGYSTLKNLGGIAEESTEELAGGILDPILTNLAYGNKAYERTEGAQVRSNLQMNSMSLQDQLNALVAQGYDREEMLNMYASEISSEEYKAETIADLMNSGYSEKEANKLAAQMQNYMLASLSGDEKALKKAEDSVVREFGKYSDIRSSFSWSETGEAMASAAIMVAATGAPGMATRNQQGAAIKKAYEAVQGGRNAASNISWSALTLDDEKMASRAQAMYEQAQKGEDLANEQYAELHQALMKQRDINIKNAESSYETARKMADKDRLFARGGTNGVDENNNVIYTGAVTQRAATTLRGEISVQLAQAEEAFGQMDDAEKHDTIEGITSVLLGQATPDTVESLTTNHPIARSIYESITGEKLPASNEATRNALFEASANNYVEMARAETVEAIDVGKGGIDENYMNQFGSEGQDVYKKLSDGKSVEDSTAYVDYVSTISKVYDAGAKGLSEKAAIELAATQGISEADAKELYEAGKSDATTSAGGRVTTSFKNGGNLRNSAREVYMAIAKMFNVNIELTDDISVEVEVDAKKSKDKTDESEDGENKQEKEKEIRQANGQYDAKTNTLTLNLNEDITKNIGYTVMHELTHKIKTNNLAGYKAFARMFEERWIEKNGQESFDKAIQDKIDAYEKAGITFTKGKEKEDALEEIICDQMGELLHDRAFISRFAAEETDGAVSVLSAIRDIIRKITQLFAVHGGFRSDYNEALLSELGLLREAEMFFANSIQEARSQQTQEMLEKQSGGTKFLIAERAKPSDVTEEDVLELLEKAKTGRLNKRSYIPVRANTPEFIIALAKEYGLDVENRPMIMPVIKAIQVMEDLDYSYNGNKKPHGMTSSDIVEIMRRMAMPEMVCLQNNGRLGVIVKSPITNGAKGFSIVDFDAVLKNQDIMNGYEGGGYNVVVTTFEATDEYIENYLENYEVEILYNKNDLSQGSNIGGISPSLFNDKPFSDKKVSQNEEDVKQENPYEDIEKMFLDSAKLSLDDYSSETDKDYIAADSIKYSLVKDEGLIDRLNAETENPDDYIVTYRAMAKIDGKYYPPMSSKIRDDNGNWVLQDGLSKGDWVMSDPNTNGKMFNNKGEFVLMKDNGSTVPAAYNPYIHSSATMLNDQFSTAYKRPNIVVVKGYILKSDINSGYRAENDLDDGRHVVAKDTTGLIEWKAGPVQAKLTGKRKVYLSQYFKVVDEVSDDEVAKNIQDMLGDSGVAVPYNVVTPSVRKALLKLGVPMEQAAKKDGTPIDKYRVDLDEEDVSYGAKLSLDSEGRELTPGQQEFFKESKIRDENGQLLVVYHGTDAEFDVFKNTGSGHYFTANPKYAERYGSNVRAFYLNIVKPFDVTQDSVREDFVQFVRDGYSNSLHPTTSIADIYKAIENGIDWTEADNLIEWIEENELDYDGLVIDEGGDLDENGEVFDRGNSYVSFNSNQAKLTSNENPTENESVKFSMDAPYEETRDLVAVHNVKESDIAGLLKLNGIPMPSIAVIKAAQGHDMYGEYSFVFGKDTIDPAKNKANKVYGGDAWTPVFPTVEYEVRDDKAFDAFRKRIADLTAGARQEVRDTLYGLDYTDMFNDKLRSNNGLEKFKEALLDDTRMMQVFLDTKGQYVDTIVKKEEDTMSAAEVEKHKFIIDKLGEDVVRASVPDKSSGVKIGDYRREYLEKNGEAIKEAYKAYGMEIIGLPEDVVDQTIEGMNRFELFKIPRTALQYLDEGPTKVKETPDYRGTEDAIREKTDEAEYKKWLDDLFGGLTIQEGLYNGKDYYAPSGNRRSFNETHMDATLNNIVKAMKLHENGETMLGHSFKAVAQKKYDSIADIKADSKRLEKMSEEEYSEKNKEFADRESKIIDRFFDDVKIGAYDNPFIIRDTINTILVDSIRNAKSSADVLSELKEYPYTKNATKADADAIWQLVEDVANMPTGYFEAKPERAVTFDEVQAVIAPDNAPSEIIDGLKEQNVDVVTYEAGNEEDRKDKLNSLNGVKFSIDKAEADKFNEEYRTLELWKMSDSEAFDAEYEFYKRWKQGEANENTFFYNTICNWSSRSKRPKGAPDYVSRTRYGDVSSEYWYTKNGVYRGSNHWGVGVASCDWTIDGEGKSRLIKGNKRYAFAKWEEFVFKARIAVIDGEYYLVNFDNVVGKGDVETDSGKVFSRDSYEKEWREVPVVSEDAVIKYSISKTDDSTSFIADCLEGDTSDEAQARRQKARDEVEAALADIVRKDTQLTYGKTLNRKSVKKPIKDLVFGLMESSENTHRDKMNMVDFVMDSADAIWHKFHNKDTDLSDLMLIVSREVVENIKFVDDEMYQAYQDLRRYLRNNRISVPEFLKEDISWADYRKKNFGRMRLVSGTAHSIDGKWEEIVPLIQPFVNEKNYGNGYGLSEVENEAEMFFALDEALDNTKAYRDAYADGFAQDIEIQFAKDLATITLKQGEAWESFADKKKEYYETRAKEMQARHKVAMRELREQRDKKLAEAEQKRKDDLAKQKQKYEQREEKRKAEEREKKEKQKAKKQDHRARMKAFGHIEKNYNWLTKRLLDPKKEDDQHIPEGFINSLASVLSAFDLQTERSKSLEERTGKVSKPTEALRKMREELQELSKEDESGIFVYNGALFSIVDNLIKSLDGHPLRDLNTEDLTNIDDMLASIKHMIQNENRLFADAKKQAASSAGDAVIKESKEKIARYGRRYERKGLVGELDHILNEDMMTPMNFFKSLGTQMRGLYKHLRYGQDDYIRKIDELRHIFDDMFKPYRKKGILGHARSGSVIEEWQNDKSAQTFKVASGEEVTMSVAQMMSLYCLSKREQAMQHILGNGVVLSDVKMTKLMDKVTGKVERSALSVRLTYDDVIKITDSLTQEQKELAQKMQELMNGKLQEWGNETSMQLYGIRLFKEKNYFPIESSDWYLPGEIGKASGIKGNKITSFGFTKPLTEGANNPIVIGDIFDIVTDHANKMALYSAYAAPLTDFNRVMNYVKRDEETGLIEGSVKQVLQDAYGPRAIKFIDNLLDDINGQANTRMDGIKELINKSLGNYKSAAIGFNLRVLVQQPTAILRATYYINPKYFINPSEANLKKNVREMHEHCPISAWKAWGNYQNDFSRGLQDVITNNSNSMWETMTMGIYGFADDMTWGMIWGAVKNEIKAKHPNVEYGSEEFWILCNERASLVFDETQVVDSVFHRSDAMRNKDTATKMVTSFMSEPTRTYNMIRSSIVMSYRMVKDGDTVGATKEMTKAITVFIANAAAVSAAAAVVDALRGKGGDDDDDWYELWMANFLSNLKNNGNLLNNIVWIKDISGMIVNAMSGEYLFGTSNMALEGWYKFARGLADIKDVMSGDMSIFEFITGDFGSGLGYITGVPTFNMLREVKTLWTKLGLPVFAEDGTVESSSGTVESVLTEGIFSKLGIGPSEAERYAKHTDKLTKKYSGKSDENMLEMATDGYRKLVDNRDFSELSARREAIRRAGGDVDAFDEKIHSYVGTSYKKTIGDSSSQEDFDSQQAMKDWMLSNGWTEQQISDVVYRSDTAREFKAACRMLDHDAAVTALTPLLEAGLTEQDIYKLWNNRNRGNYDTSSTGTYVWGTEGTITSGFGNRGYVTPGASSYHQGIDIGAEMGTKVVAADGGVVTFAGNDGSGYGNYIIVTHDNGTQTYYGHLSGIGVRKGQRVSQSQPIGNVGSTGISTGPHLHFAMKINGSFVDPSKYIKK